MAEEHVRHQSSSYMASLGSVCHSEQDSIAHGHKQLLNAHKLLWLCVCSPPAQSPMQSMVYPKMPGCRRMAFAGTSPVNFHSFSSLAALTSSRPTLHPSTCHASSHHNHTLTAAQQQSNAERRLAKLQAGPHVLAFNWITLTHAPIVGPSSWTGGSCTHLWEALHHLQDACIVQSQLLEVLDDALHLRSIWRCLHLHMQSGYWSVLSTNVCPSKAWLMAEVLQQLQTSDDHAFSCGSLLRTFARRQ